MALNVVSNAGPLMVFSKLNILHLLKELYGRVEFPLSVYRETVSTGIRRGFADAQILNSFLLQNNWKPVREIEMPMDLQSLNLDRGEKESIALALSKNALLLMAEATQSRRPDAVCTDMPDRKGHEAIRGGSAVSRRPGKNIAAYLRNNLLKELGTPRGHGRTVFNF